MRDKVICSVDVDDNMQFNPKELAFSPNQHYLLPRRPLPYQRQIPAKVMSREPLRSNNVNVCVLGKEISRLEIENKTLRKQTAAQEKVIRGFCKLHVFKDKNEES